MLNLKYQIKMNPGLLQMPAELGENKPEGCSLPLAPFIRCLAEGLDHAGIQWAVLRNAEELPEFTRYDVDLLTRPSDRSAFIETVESCANQTGWRITGRIQKQFYTCLMLMKETAEGGFFFLPLDVFTALEFRGAHYLDTADVLQSRIQTPRGLWTIPPEMDAAITLLKEWLPHGDLNERKRRSILREAQSKKFISIMTSAVGPGWAERVECEEWTLSAADQKSLRRAVRKKSRRWIFDLFFSVWANLTHLFRPSLGRVVCLAGADGSGKTTLAQGLAERTFKHPFKGCRYIHGNIGVLPRFRDMRKALGIETDHSEPEPQILQGMMEPVPAWKSVLLASYYALDFCLARLLIRRWRGQWLLTVMDRSFYDYSYQLGHRNAPGWVLNILSSLVPKPDLLLCVEGDADAIHARKPELTVDEIRIEQDLLQNLSERLPFSRILNGRDGVEAMINAGAQEIFQTLEPTASEYRFFFQGSEKKGGGDSLLRQGFGGQTASFQTLKVGGKLLAAIPEGSRFWRLFPATSRKRSLLRSTLCCLSAVGLDRLVCPSRSLPEDLISREEMEEMLERLTEHCGGKKLDWLLSWPAQIDRKRMYLIFRASDGTMSGVVKIGAGKFNRNQLLNEADVLEQLAEKELPFSVPSLLFRLELDDSRTAIALGDFPPQPRRVHSAEAEKIGQGVMDALAGLTHGDLGAANMLHSDDDELFVLDWENASETAPHLTDPVGLWLSSRQSHVLRSPQKMVGKLIQKFKKDSVDDLRDALLFLSAHDNLAASEILENGEGILP